MNYDNGSVCPKWLRDYGTEELKAELDRRERRSCPPPLEKPCFEELKNFVIAIVEEVENNEGPAKGFEHDLFEASMEAVYGKGIWNWWNKNAYQ